MPYEFLLTRVFQHFKVPLRGPKKGTKKDFFDEGALKDCDCIDLGGTKRKRMVTNLLEELVATNEEKDKLKEENTSLQEENKRLKEEMKREQDAYDAHFDKLLGLLYGKLSSGKEPGSSSC